ncbi:competence type IV pilus minor pilin ComGE [Streptococcus parasuis]|uniref:competence type IV pilus minor pilin ComGE n=1 Tax=Streptococcus parasuis TaxID=1501662 RepID=UPI002963DDD7|nr:competence type IV pilus minor pilin ComGE [Streptococcus parasuis]
MVDIRKLKSRAYVLLESLVALATLVTICSLILTAIDTGRKQLVNSWYQQEVYNVAKMAVQTGESYLELNGVEVSVQRTSRKLTVYHEGKEVIRIEKN